MDIEDTGANKKTAEFLSKKCSDIIQTVEKKYNRQTKCIVTDNAKYIYIYIYIKNEAGARA